MFTLVVINLINAPIAGAFVWIGICSGCVAIAILFNDKYKIVNNAATLVLRTIKKIVFNVPSIHFSDNPLLSSTVLGFVVLGVLIFRILYTPNESWIFLWPLVYLCLVFPMFVLCVAGAIFSSVVIARSINQKKSLYAAGIFLCGVLASWGVVSTKFFINAFGRPATLLMAYGLVSGFIALLLWVTSDFLGSRQVENL